MCDRHTMTNHIFTKQTTASPHPGVMGTWQLGNPSDDAGMSSSAGGVEKDSGLEC